jgi:hypothetical protein
MSDTKRHRRTHEVPTLVRLEDPFAAAREQAEQFVRDAFRSAYGAEIDHFMPSLLSVRAAGGELLGVLGLRNPDATPLFLEQYLAQPVEHVLAAAARQPVDRATLIEVGNFAVGAAGGGRWLITALTAYLYSAGRSWAVFTCGPQLRNAFRRFGIPLLDLAAADPGCLSDDERARWGSYYRQQPRVMAANVVESHAVLSDWLSRECELSSLWHDALQAGRVAA